MSAAHVTTRSSLPKFFEQEYRKAIQDGMLQGMKGMLQGMKGILQGMKGMLQGMKGMLQGMKRNNVTEMLMGSIH